MAKLVGLNVTMATLVHPCWNSPRSLAFISRCSMTWLSEATSITHEDPEHSD